MAGAVLAQSEDDDRLTRDQILAHPEVQGALAALDAWIEGVLIYEEVPGMSVGIVHDQELIWSAGYGYSNLESLRPADADTIYSISKLFTSIALVQLRDRGELRLDDPVDAHLDWFDVRQSANRHMRHSSALTVDMSISGLAAIMPSAVSSG